VIKYFSFFARFFFDELFAPVALEVGTETQGDLQVNCLFKQIWNMSTILVNFLNVRFN
jgi:hypothetical protein